MIKGVARERLQLPGVRLVTALMYHAVQDGKGRWSAASDAMYTITAERFSEHLDCIRDAGLPVSTICDLAPALNRAACRNFTMDSACGQAVALTFNDGVSSHLDCVLHMLWERNMPGEFFVSPGNVGRRGYLSWSELRGMASAGMSVQSYGYSHRYLDDLEDTAIANELLRSKRVIEDRLGQEVSVFAAPGGRVNAFIVALARRVGYKAVCGSKPGRWRPQSGQLIVPRVVVRASTRGEEISNWIHNRPLTLAAQTGRYRMLQIARWALGNDAYDKLRHRYLGEY